MEPKNMPISSFEKYNKLKSIVNHDFLKNRFLIFLAANKDVIYVQTSSEYILNRICEIVPYYEKIDELLDNAEDALSPVRLIEELSPFVNMPIEDKAWLKAICHELFCNDSGIRINIDALRQTLCEIKQCVANIEENCPDPVKLNDLYLLCRQLAYGISCLPLSLPKL